MNQRIFFTLIIVLSCSLYVVTCKSYQVRPEAQAIQFLRGYYSLLKSIEDNSLNQSSVFSKCKFLGNLSTEQDDFWRFRATTERERENDLKNQAALKGANVFFCNNTEDCYTGKMYRCENFKAVIAAQKEIDEQKEQELKVAKEKEQEELKAAREKEEEELYSKPHHWVTCVATGYSQMPPSMVQSMLEKNFSPKAFDSEKECTDKAWYFSQVGSNFGIQCKCKYLKLNR
jgi:hypothetical protein